jgi:hypothetical protein
MSHAISAYIDLLPNAGLPLKAGKYADLETTIDIRSADGQPALLLDGTIMPVDDAGNTGEAIPVSFAINTPVRTGFPFWRKYSDRK